MNARRAQALIAVTVIAAKWMAIFGAIAQRVGLHGVAKTLIFNAMFLLLKAEKLKRELA